MTHRIETAPRAATLLARLAAGHPGLWLVPANVCLAAPLGLMAGGAQIGVVDIHPETLSLDPDRLSQRLADAGVPVAGVLYVRGYGQTAYVEADLTAIRQRLGQDTLLVDDACLSWPDTEATSVLTEPADAVIFSTGPRKPVDLGGGAFGVLADRVSLASVTGQGDGAVFDALERQASTHDAPIFAGEPGSNLQGLLKRWLPVGKGSDWASLKANIDAALPRCRAQNAALNAIYAAGLGELDRLPATFQTWRYHLQVDDPQASIAALFEAGLFASCHYRPIDTLFGEAPAGHARRLYSRVINLFNDHNFTPAQAEQAVEVLRRRARTPGA